MSNIVRRRQVQKQADISIDPESTVGGRSALYVRTRQDCASESRWQQFHVAFHSSINKSESSWSAASASHVCLPAWSLRSRSSQLREPKLAQPNVLESRIVDNRSSDGDRCASNMVSH